MRKIFLFLFVSSLLAHSSFAQEATSEEEDPAASSETAAPTEAATPTTEAAPAEATETPAAPAKTAARAARPKSLQSWGVSLSALQWNENLKLQQGINTDKDVANYNGLIVTLQKEITYYRWGWSAGAFIGSGRANGGGNSSVITYEKSKVAFTVFGVSPRVFYRLSGRINAGVTGMAFMKNIDWPKDATNQTIDSGRNLNVMGMADLNVRLFQKWEFYSGIGPLSEGATLWKIGMNYRF
ncbi:acid shock protein [Bdellovibrio bacteriovorus]|uniref:acid shock protein n=1 Tax=Bdellovibrio TaxID=958 RepID=UPI0035A8C210